MTKSAIRSAPLIAVVAAGFALIPAAATAQDPVTSAIVGQTYANSFRFAATSSGPVDGYLTFDVVLGPNNSITVCPNGAERNPFKKSACRVKTGESFIQGPHYQDVPALTPQAALDGVLGPNRGLYSNLTLLFSDLDTSVSAVVFYRLAHEQ